MNASEHAARLRELADDTARYGDGLVRMNIKTAREVADLLDRERKCSDECGRPAAEQCEDCVVAEYQAQHPDCPDCCVRGDSYEETSRERRVEVVPDGYVVQWRYRERDWWITGDLYDSAKDAIDDDLYRSDAQRFAYPRRILPVFFGPPITDAEATNDGK